MNKKILEGIQIGKHVWSASSVSREHNCSQSSSSVLKKTKLR